MNLFQRSQGMFGWALLLSVNGVYIDARIKVPMASSLGSLACGV